MPRKSALTTAMVDQIVDAIAKFDPIRPVTNGVSCRETLVKLTTIMIASAH
jgi:hypothetical protein